MKKTIQAVFLASRPPFLLLAPLCVGLGAAVAWYTTGQMNLDLLVKCIVLSILAHASVNLLNEYHDAQSGLDEMTPKTPFSGGSGAIQGAPFAEEAVRNTGIAFALIACLLGIAIIIKGGTEQASMLSNPGILWCLGAIGLALIFFYTPWINRSAWLCLVAPGLGFGVVMLFGTAAVMGAPLSGALFLVAIIMFCLVNNLLLLNQFPDAQADKQSGRVHAVIRFGYVKAAYVYQGFIAVAVIALLFGVLSGSLSRWSLIVLPCLLVGFIIGIRAKQFEQTQLEQFIPNMAANVAVTLLTPALLTGSILLSQ